jgi:hypothetical protein
MLVVMAGKKKVGRNGPSKRVRPKRSLRDGQPALCSKLDTALAKRLCAEVRKGLVYETCCMRCRISRTAFYEWMARGQNDADAGKATPYARFYAMVQEANATAEAVIHGAAVIVNPLQILVRRWPSHYPSERQQLELSGKDGGPITVAVPSIKIFTDGKEMPSFPFRDESQASESGLPLEQPIDAPVKKIEIAQSVTGPLSARLAEHGIR